jgi:hypothetical protein
MYNLVENADAELMAVYSLVQTITANLSRVNKVQIIIEGVPLRTLRGITRIQYPLEARNDLLGSKSYKEDVR